MKPQFYTAIRGEDGRVTELQFWCAQGAPSFSQLRDVIAKTWPQVYRDSPERITIEAGIVCFRAYVAEIGRALPLLEEVVALP